MQKNSLLDVYSQKYAEGYNDRFITNPISKVSADFEFDILNGLIAEDTSWLDIGCGTGYFLSRFSGHKRAGMDISPGMLTEARKANPDALFFREGDFRIDVPEWEGKWSLLSSMWYPYSYVESLGEVEKVISNMVKWTATGGTVFLPVADLEDLRPYVPPIVYEEHEPVYAGTVLITGFTWTWVEDADARTHVNMIAPHTEHMVRLMEPYFETIEVIRYPPVYEGWVSRKAIIGRNKLATDATANHKATIIRQPIPAPAYPSPNPPAPEAVTPETPSPRNDPFEGIPHRMLLREIAKRMKNGQMLKSLFRQISK